MSTTTAPAPGAAGTSSATSDPTKFLHAVAICGVIACPVLILMPPRKLDIYTFAAAGMGVYCGNHLVRERNNGIGLMGLAGERLGFVRHPGPDSPLPSVQQHQQQQRQNHTEGSFPSSATDFDRLLNPSVASSPGRHTQPGHESTLERFSLPTERARTLHEALAADREAATVRRRRYIELKRRADELGHSGWGVGGDVVSSLKRAAAQVAEDARRHGWPEPPGVKDLHQDEGRRGQALASMVQTEHTFDVIGRRSDGEGEESGAKHEGGVKGMARKIWMGSETEGWQERRLKEEQDALDEGKGYSDLIIDQIWEVWNWDKEKDEDGNWVPKKKAEKKSE